MQTHKETREDKLRDEKSLYGDWWDAYALVKVPTLVIGGRVSKVPVKIARGIHEAVPGSSFVVFEAGEGGGDAMRWEGPQKYNDWLGTFRRSSSVRNDSGRYVVGGRGYADEHTQTGGPDQRIRRCIPSDNGAHDDRSLHHRSPRQQAARKAAGEELGELHLCLLGGRAGARECRERSFRQWGLYTAYAPTASRTTRRETKPSSPTCSTPSGPMPTTR